MRRFKVAGIIAALAWTVFGITLVIRLMAGNGGLLAAEMRREAPPEVSGLPAADYAGVGAMTAEYLTGKRDVFQYVAAYNTGEGACARAEVFRAHEAAHMADCRGLIRLDAAVCAVCAAIAAAAAALGLFRKPGRAPFTQGLLWGLRIFLGIALALLVWALCDFDGLFVTFHRLAFTNDGWLLDPRTDMLIRLMPESFFVRLGIIGAAWAAVFPLVLWAGARIARNRMKKTGDREPL